MKFLSDVQRYTPTRTQDASAPRMPTPKAPRTPRTFGDGKRPRRASGPPTSAHAQGVLGGESPVIGRWRG